MSTLLEWIRDYSSFEFITVFIVILGLLITIIIVLRITSRYKSKHDIELKLEIKKLKSHLERQESELRKLKDAKSAHDETALKASQGQYESPRRETQIESLPQKNDISKKMAESAPTFSTEFGRDYAPSEKVEFAVFVPKRISLKSSFILDVWAYLSHQYSDIMEIAKSLGRETALNRKPGVPVQRGSILTIRLEIDGLEIPESIESITWEGSPTNASFIVKVPEGIPIGDCPGKVSIVYQGITIAKIVFLLTIAPDSYFGYVDRSQKFYPRTAFASYASENSDEVLSRIQGMKKIAPDLDVFIDIFSLRSGQNWLDKLEQHVPCKDIFYLFWSKPAANSEWVEKEWRLALQRRGIEYIDPVPLEEPDYAPPPKELAMLHFNDAYLAYIAYEKLKKQTS